MKVFGSSQSWASTLPSPDRTPSKATVTVAASAPHAHSSAIAAAPPRSLILAPINGRMKSTLY